MILTITAAYDVWTSDLYQKNEALIYSFGMIVILLLVIMIIISISKSKRLKTLQRINEVAEESNQLKNAFIANMTHEKRTPLNAIVGFTTMLAEMDNLDRETRMAFLKEINDNKDSLLQLVNDLLDYSKIEANTLEYNDGEVDVNALIDEVCTTENMRSHPTGIQVEFVERLPQCRLVVDRGVEGSRLGGEGYLRIVTFNRKTREIDVKTYSTWNKAYHPSEHHNFKFREVDFDEYLR